MPRKKGGFDAEEMDYGGGSHLARRPINFDGGGRMATMQHSEDGNPSRMLMDSPRQKTHAGVRVPGPAISTTPRDLSTKFPQERSRDAFRENAPESHEMRVVTPGGAHQPPLRPSPVSTTTPSDPHELNGASRNIYTMTGTIKRGKKKQQEVVEVEVQLTQQEISKLQQSYIEDETRDDSKCGKDRGPHIALFTLLFIPLAFLASLGYSFYIGVISWYNVYLYLSEEKTWAHKILLCPLVILFFPFIVLLAAVIIGIYGAFRQLSWYFTSWLKEMNDLEKGFYGWVFNLFGIEKCCPYEVVILDDPSTASPAMVLQEELSPAVAADSQV